jgi:hypothetical protein
MLTNTAISGIFFSEHKKLKITGERGMMKKKNWRELGERAQAIFSLFGLKVTDLRYSLCFPGQRKSRALFVGFDCLTHNPNFFGVSAYQNSRRIALLDLSYRILDKSFAQKFSGFEIIFDAYVRLQKPLIAAPIIEFEGPRAAEGSVDVTQDNAVRFVEWQPLFQSGEIEIGSSFYEDCSHYKIPHILMHGRHHISPDTISVAALEAALDTGLFQSFLEIGAGVGICGQAAKLRDVKDFTFVDINADVCQYVRQHVGYPTIQSDAFFFNFNRHWNLALIGMPYELNPGFLEKQGQELANSCDTVIFQSCCPNLFDFEHDWILGKRHFQNWPWWSIKQTLGEYFPHISVFQRSWQVIIVASHSDWRLLHLTRQLYRRSFFTPVQYERVVL